MLFGVMRMNKCKYCICKTCALAKSNGGADGCGDCEVCLNTPNQKQINFCHEYYNPMPPYQKAIQNAIDELCQDDEYMLSGGFGD